MRGSDDGDALAVRLEGGALLGGDLGVGDGEEVYLVALREFNYLVIGAEFVAFFEGIGEPGEND